VAGRAHPALHQRLPEDPLLECAAYLAEATDGTSCDLLATLRNDRLNQWLPRFAADLQAAAQLRLYREIGARLAALHHPVHDHG